MLPSINKILYATDMSESARHAYTYAVSLADQYDAALTVLHVLEDQSSSANSLVVGIVGEERWHELRQANEKNVVENIKDRIATFCNGISSQMPACSIITDAIIVKIGLPAEEILALADDFDLVVMGTHGHGILMGKIMGSVSRAVVRKAKTPVLTVRLPDDRKK